MESHDDQTLTQSMTATTEVISNIIYTMNIKMYLVNLFFKIFVASIFEWQRKYVKIQ